MDSTFVTDFCNWKVATHCFSKHENTAAHKAAADFTINIPGTSRDVGEMLSTTHAKQKASSRHYLLKVVQNNDIVFK